jgi:hypothetical protein
LGTNVQRWHILDFSTLKEGCLKLLEDSEANRDNRFIYSLLLDYATAEGDKEEAKRILGHLLVIDRLRENYYKWRINQLE